jgi:hypothetical protein
MSRNYGFVCTFIIWSTDMGTTLYVWFCAFLLKKNQNLFYTTWTLHGHESYKLKTNYMHILHLSECLIIIQHVLNQ